MADNIKNKDKMTDIIDFKNIKDKFELKTILDSLYEQGFGHNSDYEFHNNKVNRLISKANKFNVDYSHFYGVNKIPDFFKLSNYDEIKTQADNYFSKFSPDDKINELLDTFYLQESDSCRTPWRNPNNISEIINWVNFRNKYNINDDFGSSEYISYYNIDKNIIKIRFPDSKGYVFDTLYKYVFDEEPNKYDDPNRFGKFNKDWQNLGKIEIKFFQNSNADIKGDLTKLKEFFFKKITSKEKNIIIKYKGIQTIINKKDQN